MNLPRVMNLVADFLDKERVPYAVAGALALQAHGLSRFTADVDFVTEAGIRDRLVAHLESLGYETLHASPGYSNHLHPDPELGRVDFIYVDTDTARRLFAPGTPTMALGGRTWKVPRAEHLAAMKIHAMRNDPKRKLQELADLRFLLDRPGVDRDEIRGYFERAGLREEWDELEATL